MVGRKTHMAVNLVANPYPAPKAIVSDITICEICDNRPIKTKDWNAHKGSKKHRLNEDGLRGSENVNKGGLAGPFNGTDAAGGWGSSAFPEASNDGNRANTSNFNGACYGCGQEGHSKRDCPVGSGNRGCFNCGEQGHTKAECPNPRQGGGGGGGACYGCGEQGHNKANCPTSSGGGARGARGGGGGNCHNCGNPGHRKIDCTEPRAMICRNCDEKGHMSRECPKPKDWSKHKCSNCGNFGHGPKRCPEPPKENDHRSGGGGGGWDTAASSDPTGDWDNGNDTKAQGDWGDSNAAGAGAPEEGAALW